MIQVYKKNDLFVIENTITETIYPNLTREETVELLKKFDRDEPEDRCDFAIKEDNISFEYASIDDKDKIIADLETKLAEKEKEIESYKHFKITIGTMENNQVDISSTTYTDQDKISFALEQLEQIRKEFEIKFKGYKWEDKMLVGKFCNITNEIIDNQINELKKVK